MFIIALSILWICAVSGIDFQVEFTPGSLSQNGWVNEGTESGKDMAGLKGTAQEVDGVNALCWDVSKDNQANIDYINYNTNSAQNPDLTMIVWVRPQAGFTPVGNDWLLGHDNGGWDRSIIVWDGRYGGIAMGVGRSYGSTVSYPEQGVFTSIAATFSKSAGKAIVYKNGGAESQEVDITSDSGGASNVGLNGLKNFGNHGFVGCIGRVEIINRVLTAAEIKAVYDEGILGDPCANVQCGPEEICEAGACFRDCGVFAIDDFLNDCSNEFSSQNDVIDDLQSQISDNDNDISTLNDEVTTAVTDLQGQISENDNDISALNDEVTTAVTDLQEQIDGNDGDITTLQEDITTLQEDLQGKIDVLNLITAQFQNKLKEKGQGSVGAAMFDGINDDLNKPNSSVYVFNDNSWIQILMVVIVVLLVCNIGFMVYVWCGKKQQKGKYKKVRYMDSEDVDSEANLK